MSWTRTIVRYAHAQSAAYAGFICFYYSYQAKIRLQSLQMSSRQRRTVYVRDRRAKSSPETAYDFVYKNTAL